MRGRLWVQLAPYRVRHPAVRWLEPETWHLTLLFLGSVPVGRVPALVSLVDDVAAQSPPVRVTIKAGGGRLRRQDAVAWLTFAGGADRIVALATLLATACPDGITTGPPPRRTPAAHLTVARHADRALLDDLTAQRYGPLRATWSVDRVALVRSHLAPSGAHYETQHEAALYAAAT